MHTLAAVRRKVPPVQQGDAPRQRGDAPHQRGDAPRQGRGTLPHDRMGPARPPAQLSAEDHALWQRLCQSITPLHSGEHPSPPYSPGEPAGPAHARHRPRLAGHSEDAGRDILTGQAPPAGPPRRLPDAPALRAPGAGEPALRFVELSARSKRRIARETLPVEARIDLHGMSQARAHAALNVFVRNAARAGLRRILVITGQGKTAADGRSGVLRAHVPHWLSVGAMAGLVSEIAQAHRVHGGAGAFYVRLRRPR